MDYGLLGGLGEGLKQGLLGYQAGTQMKERSKQDAEELALRKRLAKFQELESAAKLSDITGEDPNDIISRVSGESASGKPAATGLLAASSDDQAMGMALDGMQKKKFTTKREREDMERIDRVNATLAPRGLLAKKNPATGALEFEKLPASEAEALDLQLKRAQLAKLQRAVKGEGGGFSIDPETGEITGNPGKAPTEQQSKANMFSNRMKLASKQLEAVKDFDPTSQTTIGDSTVFGVPVGVPERLKSAGRKQYEAAADAWISGVLRKESGATIPDSELFRYRAIYFPQPGDSPEVVQNKAAQRAQAQKDLELEAKSAPLFREQQKAEGLLQRQAAPAVRDINKEPAERRERILKTIAENPNDPVAKQIKAAYGL